MQLFNICITNFKINGTINGDMEKYGFCILKTSVKENWHVSFFFNQHYTLDNY